MDLMEIVAYIIQLSGLDKYQSLIAAALDRSLRYIIDTSSQLVLLLMSHNQVSPTRTTILNK